MPEATVTPQAADPNASPQQKPAGAPPDPGAATPASPAAADPNAAPAAASSSSWAKAWLKEDGSLDHTALEKAPDELKPLAKEIGRYKSLDDLLKGWKERETFLGKKGILEPLPKDASPEQKAERAALLRRAQGGPEKPEGYGLTRPQDLPEVMWDQKLADQAAQLAHKHGLSPDALKELVGLQVESVKVQSDAIKAADQAWYDGQDKLIREFSLKEGMDYGKALDFAKRAGIRFGVGAENPLFKNASFVLMAARIGRLLQEDRAVTGDVNDFSLAANMSPEAARKEAEAIRTDKNHPLYAAYWNRDGKHKPDEVEKARARARQMSAIAYKDRPQRVTPR